MNKGVWRATMKYRWNKPETSLGRWSVRLNTLFLAVTITSLLLVTTGVLNFDDRWWDITVPILIVVTLTALVTGILALRKEKNGLIIASVALSSLTVLFLLTHSLFISD
jgi:hypothetical protein